MRIVYAAAAVLLTMACSQTPRVNVDPESGGVDVDMERRGAAVEEWRGTLTGQGATPGITGTTVAHVTDDLTHAIINISGAPSGGTHPWHIHEGQCGDNGPIVGPASAYPPLRPGSDGRATAQVHLADLELNEAKNYYVNVHASPTNMGTIVACGRLDD